MSLAKDRERAWVLMSGQSRILTLCLSPLQVLRGFLDLFVAEQAPQERLTSAIKFIIIPMVQVRAPRSRQSDLRMHERRLKA